MLESRKTVVHGSVNSRRVDADNADIIGCKLDSPRFCQTRESPFRSGIVRKPVAAAQTHDGRVIDDNAALCLHHVGNDSAGNYKRTFEVDIYHRVPLFVGHLVDRSIGADTCVIEKYIYLAELGDSSVNGIGDGFVVSDIARSDKASPTESFHFLFQALELIARAERVCGIFNLLRHIKCNDIGTLFGESESGGSALTVCCAGYKRNFVFKIRHYGYLHLCDICRALRRAELLQRY